MIWVLLLLQLLVAFLAVATLLAILFPRRPLLGVPQHWGLQLWQLALAALIGSLLMGEGHSGPRLLGALLVLIGVACVALAR